MLLIPEFPLGLKSVEQDLKIRFELTYFELRTLLKGLEGVFELQAFSLGLLKLVVQLLDLRAQGRQLCDPDLALLETHLLCEQVQALSLDYLLQTLRVYIRAVQVCSSLELQHFLCQLLVFLHHPAFLGLTKFKSELRLIKIPLESEQLPSKLRLVQLKHSLIVKRLFLLKRVWPIFRTVNLFFPYLELEVCGLVKTSFQWISFAQRFQFVRELKQIQGHYSSYSRLLGRTYHHCERRLVII